MNIKNKFKIIGHGIYLPEQKVDSSTIEKELKLSDNWIFNNVGVKSRHRVSKTETNSYMGAKAFEKAINNANVGLNKVDYLIGASATFDCPLPNKSALIKAEVNGAENFSFPCVDIDTTCLSFVTALEYASFLFNNDDVKTIVIVSSEIASYGIHQNNPETYSLFGDAATAFVLQKTEDDCGLIKHKMETYSVGATWTIIEGGGNKYPIKNQGYDTKLHSFNMEGSRLLKAASEKLPLFFNSFFTDIKAKDVDVIVPHQASKFGISLLKRHYPVKETLIIDELDKYGNCIAASIPLALAIAIDKKQIKRGDNCFLFGTAAGLSIGGLVFKY